MRENINNCKSFSTKQLKTTIVYAIKPKQKTTVLIQLLVINNHKSKS